jgi:glycosyltransferase involved in cell wall biosynthesis
MNSARVMKNRKAVVFVSNVIDSPIYRSLMEFLKKNDWDVTYIFLGNETKPLMQYASDIGLSVIYQNSPARINILAYIFKNGLLINRIKPVITLTLGQTATLVGLSASLIFSKATRIYLRMHTSMNSVENYRFGKLYDRVSNRLAERIIVPNTNTRQYLIGAELVDPKVIKVIEFGFDLEGFLHLAEGRLAIFKTKYGLTDNFYYLGIVSRFAPAKGLEYSIPAIAQLMRNFSSIKLLIAGVGEEISGEFQTLLDEIPNDRLILINRVDDMPAFYNSIDAFVHTPVDSTVESFGLVYVEAMASGLPCIFTLSGVAKDFARNGSNCLIVEHKNVLAIYEALKRLYCDTNLSKSLSKESPIAVSNFSMTKMCKKYLEVFDSELTQHV